MILGLNGPSYYKPGRYDKFEGLYQSTRRVYSNVEILASIANSVFEIEATSDGYLMVDRGAGPVVKLVEITPLLFRDVEKERYYEFVEDDSGDIIHLKAISTFDKIAIYQHPLVKVLFILCSIIIIFLVFITFSIKSFRKLSEDETNYEKSSRRSLLLTLGVWIIFFVMFIAYVVKIISSPGFPFDFPSTIFIATLAIGIVATALSFYIFYLNINVWKTSCWNTVMRVVYSTTTVVIAIMLLYLNSLHLIGFNYY